VVLFGQSEGQDLLEEGMRGLHQNAGAVSHQRVGTHGAAVFEVLEDFETLLDHFVAGLVLDVGDHADAAGIMLVGGIVKTLGLGAASDAATMLDQGSDIGFSRRDREFVSVPRVCHGMFLVSLLAVAGLMSLCRVHPGDAGLPAGWMRFVLWWARCSGGSYYNSTARKSKHVHAWGVALHPNGHS
jgi:hypothetical protein